jgi:hypothetical protein
MRHHIYFTNKSSSSWACPYVAISTLILQFARIEDFKKTVINLLLAVQKLQAIVDFIIILSWISSLVCYLFDVELGIFSRPKVRRRLVIKYSTQIQTLGIQTWPSSFYSVLLQIKSLFYSLYYSQLNLIQNFEALSTESPS